MSDKPRVPMVTPGTRPELAKLEERIKGARGRISPLYTVLLNSPEVASGWEQLFTAIRQKTSVPPALRELVILRIAVLNGADYEFNAHVPHALAAGMTQDAIDRVRLAAGGRSRRMTGAHIREVRRSARAAHAGAGGASDVREVGVGVVVEARHFSYLPRKGDRKIAPPEGQKLCPMGTAQHGVLRQKNRSSSAAAHGL